LCDCGILDRNDLVVLVIDDDRRRKPGYPRPNHRREELEEVGEHFDRSERTRRDERHRRRGAERKPDQAKLIGRSVGAAGDGSDRIGESRSLGTVSVGWGLPSR
jgi:hypothetical protein